MDHCSENGGITGTAIYAFVSFRGNRLAFKKDMDTH